MSDALDDLVGQQLGNYRLIRLLGQGGFARVYLGENIYIGTQAAIKVLLTQIELSEMERFRDEARTIARLRHPHIVQLIDFGIHTTTPYLVMSYAPHGHLRTLHPSGRALPLSTVVSYVKQIASALQFAHEHKVIHRDVKPENILLGENDELLLSDFGIAFTARTSQRLSPRDITGTLAYMAPEQSQGRPGPASDQYSLAVMTYELCTGTRPFKGSFAELLAQHFSTPPAPLREKMPSISLEVEQVVLRALKKNPQERFPTVLDFAMALEQASEGQDEQDAQAMETFLLLTQPQKPATPSNDAPDQTSLLDGVEAHTSILTPPTRLQQADMHTIISPDSSIDATVQQPDAQLVGQHVQPPRMTRGVGRRKFPRARVFFISIALLIIVLSGVFALPGPRTILSSFLFPDSYVPTQIPAALPIDRSTMYNANWSQDLNSWTGGSEWKWIENGLVGSDGSMGGSGNARDYYFMAPYHPSGADYAVEAQVQFIRFTSTSSADAGVLVRTGSGDDGYFCGIDSSKRVIIALVNGGNNSKVVISNTPGPPFEHLYITIRVEVKKNVIAFFINGRQMAQAIDNTYLNAGMVGLRAMNAVVDVHSFQVKKI